MESPLGALRYYQQRRQASHLWNEVPHLFSAPSPFRVSLSLNLSLFPISTVTSSVLGLVTPLKRKLLTSKEMHDNKPPDPLLIYSNGPYGVSAVTSISGTVLIFNIVVRELHTHADIFQMIADFHFLKTSFSRDPELKTICRTLTK